MANENQIIVDEGLWRGRIAFRFALLISALPGCVP